MIKSHYLTCFVFLFVNFITFLQIVYFEIFLYGIIKNYDDMHSFSDICDFPQD